MAQAARQIRELKSPDKQRGVAMVLVTIGMLAILAMAGLALDMGEVFINKTRLQNALDAAALSAAKQLVITGGDMTEAETTAKNTFALNQDEGNEELAAITDVEIDVEFSDTLVPWVPNSGSNFVQVSVDSFSLNSLLISVLGINTKPVVASATAGPATTACNNLFPLLACGDPGEPPDPVANTAWGYTAGDQVILKIHSGPCPEPPTPENPDPCNGPGNFNVLDVGSGANAVRDALCGIGEFSCVTAGDLADTEPGNMVGPVGQGLNTMFGEYQGPVNPADCPADTNVSEYIDPPDIPPFFADYLAGGPNSRRVVPVPIGVCTEDEAGKKTVTILDTLCFLITRKAETSGNTQIVYGEFLDLTQNQCLSAGNISPNPNPPGGPVIIVLYKDQDMNDG